MDDATLTADRRTTTRRRSATPTSTARWRPPTCSAPAGTRPDRSASTTWWPCRPTRPDGWPRTSPPQGASTSSPSSSARPHRTATRSPPCSPPPPRCPSDDGRRGALVRAVALATPLRLRSALDEVGADPALAEVLAQVADVRAELAAGPPYRWWGAPEMTMAEPPGSEDDVFRGPERDPQVLRPPRRGRHRTPRRRGGRPAVRGHPRSPATQGRRPRRQLTAGAAGRRDHRARGRAAARPHVDRGHRQPTRAPHGHRPRAVPDGDDDVHREVRRGARARAPARAPGPARRPGRRGRLAHHRRRRDGRRCRRGDGPGPARRRAARPRPAARRAAAGPGGLGVPGRRGRHVLRVDGVRRRPGRPRPGPAQHQHPRRRHRRLRDGDAAVDPVLRRPGQGLPRPGRPRPAHRPGDPARACRTPCVPSSRRRDAPPRRPCCC